MCVSTGILVVLLSLAFVSADPPSSAPHPAVPAMQQAVGGSDGRAAVLVAGLAVVALMGAMVLLGLRGARTPRLAFAGAFIAYALIFVLLVRSDAAYEAGGELSHVGGLPPPTAWLIYGMWLFPWVMIGLFVYGFDRWYYTPDDEARFADLTRDAP